MMTPVEARELAAIAVAMTHADEAEALVVAQDSALTRFANNRISQNVSEDNVQVSVRAVMGKRVGVASTNRTDEASLRACCEAAVAAARVAPADDAFPGLPLPEPVRTPERACEATRAFDAEARARAAGALIAESASRGLTAAGTVSRSETVTAVANSHGVDVGMATTACRATVLSMGSGEGAGSGWAAFVHRDASLLDAVALGRHAAETALASASPRDLEPGEYTVVLAPDAVADLMDFLAYVGFSAKAFHEGRSFMSGHIEDGLMTELVSITDDALAEDALGITFDYEGAPKRRVPLIEYGVATKPVTDSYWASRTGWDNTGHALPAPNQWGPMPLNLAMAPGDATLEELISRVERGVFVTRFHYVNVEDPIAVTLTGMTRDGTFLIEDGKLGAPLKNLRFTQSAVAALAHCEGVTREHRFVGTEEGAVDVPGVLITKFAFTGQTS